MLELGVNLREQLFEKVESAVNIADDIGAVAACAGRFILTSRGKAEH